MIVDPNGKPIESEKFAPCPQCGRPAKDRFPSSGFGTPHTVCPCGKEFKELPWQLVTP